MDKFANATEFAAPITLTTGVDAVATVFAVSTAAPVSLRSGTARFRVGNELVIATIPADGASPWTVVRGAEGSMAAAHLSGVVVKHVLTAATTTSLDARLVSVEGRSGLPSNVLTKTANFTAADGDFILADAAAGAFTITLPASGTVIVVKTDASANAVAVAGTINGDAGGASIAAKDYGSIFKSTATNVWRTIPAAPSGTDGTDGTNGNTILNGTVVPTTEGVNGDFYLRTTTSVLYGPKTAGAWGAGTSLVGAAGTNGTNATLSTIEDEGTPLTARATMNFAGAGVTATDAGGKTLVTIPGSAGGAVDVQVFSANASVQTWTKPAGASFHTVLVIGAGGGGGSGRRGAAATVRNGGSGGGGGHATIRHIRTSLLSATENVQCGLGGAGAAAQTVNDTNGIAGSLAGQTWFKSAAFWEETNNSTGGLAGTAAAIIGGRGGFAAGTSGMGGGGTNLGTGSAGAVLGGATVIAGSPRVATGGGGGGGLSAGDVSGGGGTGGGILHPAGIFMPNGGAGGGANGVNGTAGAVVANDSGGLGGGGGGGGNSAGGAGGNGAVGAFPGGGGGGGGGSLNGSNSGAGAAGADGLVVVVSW